MAKTCFVIMGFHTKVDWPTGRMLDLDKTYRGIIKPAAEAAGFFCTRADEIQHAGVIDVPMYDQLLNADLVIADLSTQNPNAFFELGVRYALRPRTTIVIAEKGFSNPFDTNHITARRYRHDGEALDFEEVERFRAELTGAISVVVSAGGIDSPVYTMLHHLEPPRMRGDETAEADADAARRSSAKQMDAPSNVQTREALEKPLAAMLDLAQERRSKQDFAGAVQILDGIRAAQGEDVEPYVVQQLALMTYKSEQPTATEALLSARRILVPLDPRRSLDSETVGLWGAVHKRLADAMDRSADERRHDLDEAISAVGRGFQLLHDHYNGVNAAFLYDLRASRTEGESAIADRVIAQRYRQRVLAIIEQVSETQIGGEDERERAQRTYWVQVSRAEALLGLGFSSDANRILGHFENNTYIEEWMKETTDAQLKRLKHLLG